MSTLSIIRGEGAAAKEVRGEDAVGLHHGDGGEDFLVGEDKKGREGLHGDSEVLFHGFPNPHLGR